MKKLFVVVAFMAAFAVSEAMAAGSIDGGNDNSGNSSSENNTDTTVVRTKYSVSAAEAAATDGDTNSVSWTFE